MSHRLVLLMPIAQKTWWYYTLETGIDPKSAIDVAEKNMHECVKKTVLYRQKHTRPFKYMPRYFTFYVMRGGQPNIEKTRQIGKFRIWLEDQRVDILYEWN